MDTMHKTMEEIMNTPPSEFEQQVDGLLKQHAVKFTICEEDIIVPLYDNLDSNKIYWWDSLEDEPQDILTDCFNTLKEKYESKEWGYYEKAYDVELIPVPDHIKDPKDITECNEFWNLYCYTELMVEPELYSTPYSNSPQGNLYSSQFAADCMRGYIYSKDFAYFTCDCCGREICEQNPSNGWHVQYRFTDEDSGERICTKCLEEQLLENGVDIDEVIRTKSLSNSLFFNSRELEDVGFETVDGYDGVLIGSGYSGYQDPNDFFSRLEADREMFNDKIVIFDIDAMGIGGLGGYITLWWKDKK